MSDSVPEGPASVEARPGTLSTTPPPDLPEHPRPVEAEAAPTRPAKRATTRAGRKAQSAAAKAKRAAQGESTPKAVAGKPVPRRASLETRLAGSIASLGTGLVVAGAVSSPAIQADGMLVVEHAPSIAKALDGLAKDNPAVANTLERMLTAGAWSGVIAAMMPVALGVAANHGALPAPVLAMLQGQAEPDPAGG